MGNHTKCFQLEWFAFNGGFLMLTYDSVCNQTKTFIVFLFVHIQYLLFHFCSSLFSVLSWFYFIANTKPKQKLHFFLLFLSLDLCKYEMDKILTALLWCNSPFSYSSSSFVSQINIAGYGNKNDDRRRWKEGRTPMRLKSIRFCMQNSIFSLILFLYNMAN